MCELVLGKGESWLHEIEGWIQGAEEFVVYLEDQLQEWEGVKCSSGWKDYGMEDAEGDEYLGFLRHSRTVMKHAVLVETLNAKAVRMLRTLRTFHNSTKAFDVVFTPRNDDRRWKNGASSSTRSKTYRVVMPLWYFQGCLHAGGARPLRAPWWRSGSLQEAAEAVAGAFHTAENP